MRIILPPLTIALPAGRLYPETVNLLKGCGLDLEAWRGDERRLLWTSPDGRWRFLVARPADVATYVQLGPADLGVTGKDSLMESQRDVYELLDLGFGHCRLVLAAPGGRLPMRPLSGNGHGPSASLRVATKYPRFTRLRLEELGLAAQVITLHGATELAAVAGLAEAVVDAVETGATLRNNGLAPVKELAVSSARLICNRAAFQLRREEVAGLAGQVRDLVEERAGRE
ncbi:MAG: ATP phosphoribosyltransferase [Bacillota bacterium]